MRDVADELGIGSALWLSYERGTRPSVDTFFRLCDYIGINPNELRLPAEVEA